MNWLSIDTYVPGVLAVVAVGMGISVAEKAYRWIRPQQVSCDLCGGRDRIDVVIDTPAQTLAFHDSCLDGRVTNLAIGWTGSWRGLDRHLSSLTADQEPAL